MTAKRVVITGMGCVTPIGNNLRSFWQSLTTGKSGVDKITYFDVSEFSSKIAAEVKQFDATQYIDSKALRRMDRFVHVIARRDRH